MWGCVGFRLVNTHSTFFVGFRLGDLVFVGLQGNKHGLTGSKGALSQLSACPLQKVRNAVLFSPQGYLFHAGCLILLVGSWWSLPRISFVLQ